MIRSHDHLGDINSALARLLEDEPSGIILSDSREEHDRFAQPGKVLGDIARNATRARPNRTWRRGAGPDCLIRAALRVNAGSSNNQDVRLARHLFVSSRSDRHVKVAQNRRPYELAQDRIVRHQIRC